LRLLVLSYWQGLALDQLPLAPTAQPAEQILVSQQVEWLEAKKWIDFVTSS
jgi:hypothetical protein